jgi:glycosyltransferase involved in cell wall biosynthesis/SAM-dependent methyltransferase
MTRDPLDLSGVQVLKSLDEVSAARALLQQRGLSLTEGVATARGIRPVGDVKKSWDVQKTVALIEHRVPREGRILDLGSVNCEILPILHKLGYQDLAGVDLDPKVTEMPFADRIHYRVGNFLASGLAPASFDAITSISVIEHGFNGPALLAEVSRLLKPGGVFIASTDYWETKLDTAGKQAFGLDWRIFSADELRAFFAEAERYGLRVTGPQNYAGGDRVINWNDRDYSFVWFALEKIAGPAVSKRPARPRAAILSTFNQQCGIATHTGFLLEGLRRAMAGRGDIDPDILILAEETDERLGTDPDFVRRCWKRRNGDDFSRALAIIEAEDISILHIQFHGFFFVRTGLLSLVQTLVQRGIRVVVTSHTMDDNYLPDIAALSRVAQRTLVFLDQAVPRLVAFGGDAERIAVAPHGTQGGRPLLSLAEAKKAAGVPEGIKLISSFGFLQKRKGIAEIIEALPAVLKSVPNLFFMNIGGGHPHAPEDAAYFEHCRALVAKLGLAQHVDFVHGYIPDEEASRLLSASDAVILNYQQDRNEVSGAAMFALSHGRPLITSAGPPFVPLLGCTLQVSSYVDLATAIALLLTKPALSDLLVSQAARYIEANSYDRLAALLIADYVGD